MLLSPARNKSQQSQFPALLVEAADCGYVVAVVYSPSALCLAEFVVEQIPFDGSECSRDFRISSASSDEHGEKDGVGKCENLSHFGYLSDLSHKAN